MKGVLEEKSTMVYKRQSKKKKNLLYMSFLHYIYIYIYLDFWLELFFFNINIDQKIIEKVNLMDKNTNY